MAKLRISKSIWIIIAVIFMYISQSEAGSFFNPTGPGYKYYSQDFKGKQVHEGTDITGFSSLNEDKNKDGFTDSIEGQPAKAAKDGKVIYADWQVYYDHDKNPKTPPIPLEKGDKSGWGKVVIIDHEDGTTTVYGHLKDINWKHGVRQS